MNCIENHILTGENIQQIEGPKRIGKGFNTPDNLPDSIVIHYTAGSSGIGSASYLAKSSTKSSAHIVIDRDGKIIQLIPFRVRAAHAGKSVWNGRKYLNQYSIGIEIDNAGPLEKIADKYVSWFKKKYKEEDGIKSIHRNETKARYWHTYTKEQIDAVENVCKLLIEQYDIKIVVGHEEISPGRKTDPGPAFPLDSMREVLFNLC